MKLDLIKLVDVKTIQTVSKNIGGFIFKNSPTILTGLGLAGVVASVISAIKDANKARDVIFLEADKRSDQWANETGEDPSSYPLDPMFSKIEIAKLTWKCYLPTMAMVVTTGACILGANSINQRRIAALTGLYSLADTALREYQEKTKEVLGERKEAKLREDLDQKHLDDHPLDPKTLQMNDDTKKTVCFDPLTGRYWMDSVEHVIWVQNEFNRGLNIERYLTLNELYDKFGLEHTALGENLGWTADVALVEFSFTSRLAQNNTPCLVLNFKVMPHSI